MPIRRLAVAALALFALAPALQAQEDSDGWDLALEFGLNGASGNSDFTVLRGGATATRTDTDRYELDFSAVVRYGTNESEVIANDARAAVSMDWRPEATFSPFVFADGVRDEIRNLDFRFNGGAGAKWTFLRDDAGDASLSLAALYDYENFDLPAGSTADATQSQMRWSVRFKAGRTFGEGTEWSHTSFYQPVVDNIDDFVVEVTNTLSTSLIENLSLAVEHIYIRDQVPPPGAAKDDQKFSILFRLGL